MKQNAINALLSEYEKAIRELQNVISDVSDLDLKKVVDNSTKDEDCKSIQTILAHVVSSGYSYCIYIQNSRNINAIRPPKTLRFSAAEYVETLNEVIEYTRNTFTQIDDSEIEKFDNSKKILTNRGQFYDIEQMMEHAIVHILRHRRQVEKFKIELKN